MADWAKLHNGFLHHDEAPELARIEIVHISTAQIIEAFTADRRRPFERILPEVDDGRHVGGDLFSRPSVGLLDELKLEVINSNGAEVGSTEI